jgi:hypothetical protein
VSLTLACFTSSAALGVLIEPSARITCLSYAQAECFFNVPRFSLVARYLKIDMAEQDS